MKKWIAIYAATVLAFASTLAFGQLTSTGAGKKATAAATYTGPANIVASPTAWYGMRAMSTADRGNKLLNVCNVADVVCADFSSDATTGALVISTVGGSSCSIVVCTIKTMYDRSGSGQDATQSTIGTRPTLVVSCVNSLPCAAFSSQRLAITLGSSVSQPLTMSAVAIRTGGTTSFSDILAQAAGSSVLITFTNSANTAGLFGGSSVVPTKTAADNAWHALQGVFDTTAVISVDNAEASGSGSGGGSTSTSMTIGALGIGSQSLIGNITEVGLWPSGFSAGNRTAMCHNQFTYWGTSVSC